MSTIAKNEFQKSLARLEGLAKSQLFHTGSDSNPGQWAGSATQDEDSMGDSIDENGTDYSGVKKSLAAKVAASKALTPAEVAIVKGQNPLKIIGDKIAKGGALTSAESWALKGGRKYFVKGMESSPKKDGAGEENKEAAKIPDQNVADKNDGKQNAEAAKGFGAPQMPGAAAPGGGGMPMARNIDGDDDDADDKDDKKPWEKSLAGAARQQANLSKGIEMSPVLHEFVVSIGHALDGIEARILKSLAGRIGTIEKSLGGLVNDQGEFNKSMAEAVVGIGAHLSGAADAATAQDSLPAGPPRSQFRTPSSGQNGSVTPIAKSFNGPGGLESGDSAMAKSQIVDVMAEMVKSQKLNPIEVIKFESTGQLNPQIQQAVLAFAQGGGR